MTNKNKIIIRTVISLICFAVIVYFQREVGLSNLIWMLVGLAGLLGVLFEYNYSFNHPELHEEEAAD